MLDVDDDDDDQSDRAGDKELAGGFIGSPRTRLRQKPNISCPASLRRAIHTSRFAEQQTTQTSLLFQSNICSARPQNHERPSPTVYITLERNTSAGPGSPSRRPCPGVAAARPAAGMKHKLIRSCFSLLPSIVPPHHRKTPQGAITSKIKHAIKLKTSPVRLAQLLQPSLAFCFSWRPMTAYRPVLDITQSLAAS